MKKTILATAIAAAVMAAPMTAAANVVLYGKIHASIDYVDPKDDFFIPGVLDDNVLNPDIFSSSGNWNVQNRTSRIGFKGSEDLGNGLKAIWKAEIAYDITGEHGQKSGWGAGRNSYIGLAGDWGTFLVGRHDTPLKISTGRLDVFSDTMADYNSTIGFIDRRASKVLAYISPNWNGFTFAAAGVASEDYGSDLLGDGAYSIAGMYFNNGFYASAAYEDVSGTTVWDTNDVWRVGAGYIMNAFTFGAVYEQSQIGEDGFEKLQTNKWQILGAYDFGNNTVKAMFGQYDPDTDRAGFINGLRASSNNAWAIGWDHKLSVRTKVYALYADSELSLNNAPLTLLTGGAQGFSMGMVHTF
ncbi:MAG: porin [Gammaproteobacteria bacterium]|nr:porin [Gammaproteobacteria bacterium]